MNEWWKVEISNQLQLPWIVHTNYRYCKYFEYFTRCSCLRMCTIIRRVLLNPHLRAEGKCWLWIIHPFVVEHYHYVQNWQDFCRNAIHLDWMCKLCEKYCEIIVYLNIASRRIAGFEGFVCTGAIPVGRVALGQSGGKSGYWKKDGKKINNIGERGRNRRKRNVLTLHCLNRRDLQRAENTSIGCFFLIFKQDKDVFTEKRCLFDQTNSLVLVLTHQTNKGSGPHI